MILGLIGGVGSGKSAVTGILSEDYGFTILHTDDIAKALEEPGKPVYEKLVALLGNDVLEDSKSKNDTLSVSDAENTKSRPIDKSVMAAKIYADEALLRAVNEIVHPAVWKRVRELIGAERAKAASAGSSERVRVAVETALPDAEFEDICDEIWYIYADADTRIKRLMSSRGYTLEKCLGIIDSQKNEEEYGLIADAVINNSHTVTETSERIKELLG